MVHLWSSNCFLPLQNRFREPPVSRSFNWLRLTASLRDGDAAEGDFGGQVN